MHIIGEGTTHMTLQGASPDILDAFNMPLYLIDLDRHLAHMNASARTMPEEEACLHVEAGRLCGRYREGGAILRDALDHLRASQDEGSVVRIVVTLPAGIGHHVTAVLVRLRGGANGSRPCDAGQVLLALLQSPRGPADPATVAAIHGLSPAEARVANAIARGMSPTECAAEFGRQLSTVRRQLQNVYQKIGARGQADLVRKLSLAALL